MELDNKQEIQSILVNWIEKFSPIAFPDSYKKLNEQAKSISKYSSNDVCTILYRFHKLEDVILKCIHKLTLNGNFIELKNSLLELPSQIFANCFPKLLFIEISHYYPDTLTLCSILLRRYANFTNITNTNTTLNNIIDILIEQLYLWLSGVHHNNQDYSEYVSSIGEFIESLKLVDINITTIIKKKHSIINNALFILKQRTRLIADKQLDETIKIEMEKKVRELKIGIDNIEILSENEMLSLSQVLMEDVNTDNNNNNNNSNNNDNDNDIDNNNLSCIQLKEKIKTNIELTKIIGTVLASDKLLNLLEITQNRITEDRELLDVMDTLLINKYKLSTFDESIESILNMHKTGLVLLLELYSKLYNEQQDISYDNTTQIEDQQQATNCSELVASKPITTNNNNNNNNRNPNHIHFYDRNISNNIHISNQNLILAKNNQICRSLPNIVSAIDVEQRIDTINLKFEELKENLSILNFLNN